MFSMLGQNVSENLMLNARKHGILKSTIAIVAGANASGWGGSEELWSQAATRLVNNGITVAASVQGGSPLHDRVRDLMRSGVKLWARPQRYSLWARLRRRVLSGQRSDGLCDVEKFLNAVSPKLVILSTGGNLPDVEWLELCRGKGLPFVTVGQANSEHWWFDDEMAARYRQVLSAAVRCFFVSKANLRLVEKQIGGGLPNAEVVRNPFNVNVNSLPTWPPLGENSELRLACVARLDPRGKGQDILLESLARPVWMNRSWRLTLYGNGPMKNSIEHLVKRLGLVGHVTLAGHVSRVEDIWAANHVLVMPSRLEGLPLAMVEAMWCGRPIVATDVAGHSEIVEDGVSGFLADAPTVISMIGALERLWEHRHDLRMMGESAAKNIRTIVPADPIKVFCEKIQRLLIESAGVPN
jgi:glycosyltransferase involved in cell wall biosynthesis